MSIESGLDFLNRNDGKNNSYGGSSLWWATKLVDPNIGY